jgi:hypothetical protein
MDSVAAGDVHTEAAVPGQVYMSGFLVKAPGNIFGKPESRFFSFFRESGDGLGRPGVLAYFTDRDRRVAKASAVVFEGAGHAARYRVDETGAYPVSFKGSAEERRGDFTLVPHPDPANGRRYELRAPDAEQRRQWVEAISCGE